MFNNSSWLNDTEVNSTWFLSGRWIAFQTIAAFLWLCATYLLVSLITAQVRGESKSQLLAPDTNRLRMQKVLPAISLSPSLARPNGASSYTGSGIVSETTQTRTIKQKTRKVSAVSKCFLLVAATLTFIYTFIPFVELHAGWFSNTLCRVTYTATTVLYATAIASIHTILWDRQRRLYNTPAIGHLTTKCLKVASSAMIVVTVISSSASIVILNVSATGASTPNGCFRVNSNFWRFFRVIFLPILAVAQEAILLGLVIYPLKRQVRNVGNKLNRTSKFRQLMKRLAISTGVCVASDMALVVSLVAFSGQNSSGMIGQLLTGANLLVNLVSVSASFATWKKKLFIWVACKK